MENLQEEAVHLQRKKVLAQMQTYLDTKALEDVHKCSERLVSVFPHQQLNENTVFVAYGGGKDSAYVTAFVRLMQIIIDEKHRNTFKLRIATNRHSGMPYAVMANIDRVYDALKFYGDPDVELLLIDGNDVIPFDKDCPIPTHIIDINRLDILMTGHHCEGEARPTFCNACNIGVANSYNVVLSYDGGVDIIITGDSLNEQRAYFAWIRQVAAKFQVPLTKKARGFHAFLQTTDEIAKHYFKSIYGDEEEKIHIRRTQNETIMRDPLFFSIYEETSYEAGEHWDLLIDFLKFQFDDLAFNFTESDCSNPALMAHLRGLKVEHVYKRTYQEGICEYVDFALALMERKKYPPHLIEMMRVRYSSPAAIQSRRDILNQYAREVLDLTETHIVTMLYSPFIQQGRRLSLYLENEQPHLVPLLPTIHWLLGNTQSIGMHKERQEIEEQLYKISHLEMKYLRMLYNSKVSPYQTQPDTNPISIVLTKDPHKAVIQTKHEPEGPPITEIISGR